MIEKEDEEDGCFADLADQIALLMMDDDDDKAEPDQEVKASPVAYAPRQHRFDNRLPWICNNNLYYRHPTQEDLRNSPQILPVEIIYVEGQQQYYRSWANRNFTYPNIAIPSSVFNSKRDRECIGTGVFIPRCRPDSRSKRRPWLKFSSS